MPPSPGIPGWGVNKATGVSARGIIMSIVEVDVAATGVADAGLEARACAPPLDETPSISAPLAELEP